MSESFHSGGGRAANPLLAGGLDARHLLDAIPQAVVATDSAGRACYLNWAAEALIAGRAGGFCGCSPDEVLTMLDLDSGLPLSELVQRGRLEDEGRHKAGQALLPGARKAAAPVGYRITPVRGTGGGIDGAIMELREAGALDEHGAVGVGQRSPTQPVSRMTFDERLERALSNLGRNGCHALLHMALVRYHETSKACGGAAADALCMRGCHQIGLLVRQRDTLCRLGKAEFGLLMENCPLERAVDRARNIHDAMSTQDLRWGNMHFKLDVNIGVLPLRGRSRGAKVLLALAAQASRDARENGSAGICVFEDGSVQDRLSVAQDREWRQYIREVLL